MDVRVSVRDKLWVTKAEGVSDVERDTFRVGVWFPNAACSTSATIKYIDAWNVGLHSSTVRIFIITYLCSFFRGMGEKRSHHGEVSFLVVCLPHKQWIKIRCGDSQKKKRKGATRLEG